MPTNATRETYADWLARKMQEGGFTQRSLARAWKPEDPETARRAIRRYLGGMVPIARTRNELADALGSHETEPSSLDDTEDD